MPPARPIRCRPSIPLTLLATQVPIIRPGRKDLGWMLLREADRRDTLGEVWRKAS